MIKIVLKVFANLLLLIIGLLISVRTTINAFQHSGEAWPAGNSIVESTEKGWLCIGVSDVPDVLPANRLDPNVTEDNPVEIRSFRSYFSFWPLQQLTVLEKQNGELIRFEHKEVAPLLFRVAVYVLGWVGLIRFCIHAPRWLRRWRAAE